MSRSRPVRAVGVSVQIAALAALLAILGAGVRRAQAEPAPPPLARADAPVAPITAVPANTQAGPFAAPAPAAPADAPLITAAGAPGDAPVYQRWWFWTAIGAVAVTAIAVLIATSGPSAPRTDFGNMPAF